MGRISPKNEIFMNKSTMISSILTLYKSHIDNSLPLANLLIILNHIMWAWTEYNGKYKGCTWWSEKAYEQFLDTSSYKGLRHDHIVPRKELKEEIIKIVEEKCTFEELYEFLNTYLIGCVITHDEDKVINSIGLRDTLGSELTTDNKWNRYKQANIKVKTIDWSKM